MMIYYLRCVWQGVGKERMSDCVRKKRNKEERERQNNLPGCVYRLFRIERLVLVSIIVKMEAIRSVGKEVTETD